MKKIIYIIIFFLSAYPLFSQRDKPLNLPKLDQQTAHFGYSLGLNSMDFIIRPSNNFFYSYDTIFAVDIKRYVGFNINVIANLRLAEYFDLRFLPGMVFGQRNLEYKYKENGEFRKHAMVIESTFLDFPLCVKYKAARINNFRPYIIAGVSPRIDLASQNKIRPEEYPKIKIKRFDAYYELGIGADFFLEYFMFGVELKASWGISNIINYDQTQYSQVFRRLNSRMLLISFHFEGGKIDKIRWWN